jgi:hypothetical protein
MNLVLHGIEDFQIAREDKQAGLSITREGDPALARMTACGMGERAGDVVLTPGRVERRRFAIRAT